MNWNPKGVMFWLAMFCVATCVAFENKAGTGAFAVLALSIKIFG